MRGGASSLVYAGFLLAAGCASATQTGELKIRAIPDSSAKLRPGLALLADANGQLALGNVGLAIEGFRKALRERPDSADAYAGLARCYEAMGRSDLARSNYEAALALTPKDPRLLAGVAETLEQQGNAEAAGFARQEAAALQRRPQSQPQLQPQIQQMAVVDVPIAAPALNSSVTVALPPARPVAALSAPRSTMTVELPVLQRETVAMAAPSAADVRIAAPMLGSSVTVALPPARPVQMLSRSTLSVELPVLPDATDAPVRRLAAALEGDSGPYLERLSPGEVALVTSGRPAWRAQVVAHSRVSTTVRWVPIMTAQARPNIRVLNAAQRQGLASRTRSVLLDRGWRKIEIGNATDVRQRSVVLYPMSRRTLGRSLAAQFGFPARAVRDSNVLIVLLGRDAMPTKRG